MAVMASVWHGENRSYGPSHGSEIFGADRVNENVANRTSIIRGGLTQQVHSGGAQPSYHPATVPDVGFSRDESASFQSLNGMGEPGPRLMHLGGKHRHPHRVVVSLRETGQDLVLAQFQAVATQLLREARGDMRGPEKPRSPNPLLFDAQPGSRS